MANEIIKVIDELAKRFGIVIDWTNQNIIPYLEELCDKFVKYELWTSVAKIIIYMIICFIVLIGIKHLNKNKDFGVKHYTYHDDDKFYRYCCYIGVIFVLVAMSNFIVEQAFDIITCLVFPEKIIFGELEVIYHNMK